MKETSRLWTGRYVAIVVMAFLFFISLQMLTAGFPAYITDVKDNPTQGGLMTTVFMLAAIITRPLIGYLMNKVNMMILNIIGLSFVAITIGLSFNQESVGALLILRAFHGVGFGILTTVLATMATNIIPTNRLGEGIGYYGMATSVGTSIAPMLALSILQYFSYNFMIILTCFLTLATILISFFVKPSKASQSEKKKISFKAYAFDKNALLPSIMTIFFTISLGGVISFMGELGKEVGLGNSVPFFFLVISIMMVLVRPLSGRLFDSYGHKVIIYPGVFSGIVGLFLLSIAEHTWTLLLAGLFYGIAYGVVTPTLQAIAVRAVAKEKQGTANAMYFSGMDLGMAIGSTGLGFIATYKGYHFIYGFSIVFLIVLIAAYTLVLIKRKKEAETLASAS
ncbi:MFS transporter [Robertmurraya kyonggiensis]|uniref:MFS transporter n=1 Tax=Robertmurraya kyonggiensis TaxID=1037680 RepID=A0A4U1D108_9BACI|nr:MFS transporter [Robertmurraya kyonggiensis]TKC15363.1 MFS transporter [Robertmurraya kyonggiensis]